MIGGSLSAKYEHQSDAIVSIAEHAVAFAANN